MNWYWILIIGLAIIALIGMGFYLYLKFIFANKKNTGFDFQKNININLDKLIKYLGEINNIRDVEYNYSRLKIYLKNVDLAQAENIKKMKNVDGLIQANEYIVLIVGKQSLAIAERIKQEIKKTT